MKGNWYFCDQGGRQWELFGGEGSVGVWEGFGGECYNVRMCFCIRHVVLRKVVFFRGELTLLCLLNFCGPVQTDTEVVSRSKSFPRLPLAHPVSYRRILKRCRVLSQSCPCQAHSSEGWPGRVYPGGPSTDL